MWEEGDELSVGPGAAARKLMIPLRRCRRYEACWRLELSSREQGSAADDKPSGEDEEREEDWLSETTARGQVSIAEQRSAEQCEQYRKRSQLRRTSV